MKGKNISDQYRRRYRLLHGRIFAALSRLMALLVGVLFAGIVAWLSYVLIKPSPILVKAQESSTSSSVVADLGRFFVVNVPSFFKELVTFVALEVEGESIFGGDVSFESGVIFDGQITLNGNAFGQGINIDLGGGEITASNVLYSLVAGDGISISSGQNPTITNSAIPGLVKSGTYAVLASSVTRVGIGTSTPGNTVEISSGTSGTSGLTFTNLTSASSVGVGGGKVLSVDSGGNVILVTDESGGVVAGDLDSALPGGSTGSTIYFDGTTWAHTTNLYHNGGQVGISTIPGTNIRFDVKTNATTAVGMVIRRITSQTANLFELRNESDGILSYFDKDGVFNGSIAGGVNPNLTTGSVVFQGPSGLTQDNANFFWDDTNNRLGIGTTSPSYALDVVGGFVKSSVTNGAATGFLIKNTASPVWGVQVDTSGRFQIYDYNQSGVEAIRLSIDDANGNVGIGTQVPTSKLHVEGLYGGNALARFNQTGSGDILTASASGVAKMTLTNAGNLGIGTTNPTQKLEVAGQILVDNGASNDAVRINNGGYINFGGLSRFRGSSTNFQFQDSNFNIYANINVASGNSWFNVGGGNVGIGTSAPGTRLTISGTEANNQVGAGNAAALRIVNTNGAVAGRISEIQFSNFALTPFAAVSGALVSGASNSTGNLIFSTRNAATDANLTERMTILSGGNVGIGNTNPGYKLEVTGTSYFSTQARFNDALFLHSNTSTTFFGSANQQAVAFRNNSSTDGAWTSLSFADASANEVAAIGMKVTDQTNHYGALAFGTKGTDGKTTRMYIDPQGNVGIGTLVPGYRFHSVAGTGSDRAANFNNSNNSGTQYGIASWAEGASSTNIAGYFSATGATNNYAAIFANGNVGIGTTSPSTALNINGNLRFGQASPVVNAVIDNGAASGSLSIRSGSANTLHLADINSSLAGRTAVSVFNGSTQSQTSGNNIGLLIKPTYNQTSGTAGNTDLLIDRTETAVGSGAQLLFNAQVGGTSRFVISSVGNVGIGTTTFGTNAAKVLAIAGSTAPSTAITDGIQLFAVDVAGSHELRVMDEATNITTLSPHNFSVIGDRSEEMAWSFYSERNALAINADMTKALRIVEKLSGEKLIYLKDLATGQMLEDESDATKLTELADNGTIGEVAKWNYQLWTFVGEVIFEKPVQFLAGITVNGKAIFNTEAWFGGRVTFADKDMAGFAQIPAGGQEVTVTFAKSFAQKPVVTITPEGNRVAFTLQNVTSQGFTIRLEQVTNAVISFNWIALAIEQPQTVIGQPVNQVEASPQPSSSPTPQPSLTPTPSATPKPSQSPLPVPSPEISPSPEGTQSATLGR